MAASMERFESWLTEKLLSVNPDTDTDVFVSYIAGILEEESPEAEKKESILDLLGQVVENDQESLCEELVKQWNQMCGEKLPPQDRNNTDLTEHLSDILEHQKIEGVKVKDVSEEEKARKAAILAAYSTVGSGEEDESSDDGGGGAVGGKGDNLLDFKNTNAESVKINELAKREQSKQEAEKKREKDKQDRELQKQKQKERKEGEKKRTQKGERRR